MDLSTDDVFNAGLKIVIDALSERSASHSILKASVDQLSGLCTSASSKPNRLGSPSEKKAAEPSNVDLQKAPRNSVVDASQSASKSPLFIFPSIPESPAETAAGESLEALRKNVMPCTLCPQLAATRAHVVFGEGNVRAELMFLADAPGVDEDREGRPFAGESGALLDKMLVAMGFSRSHVYLASVLKCRPDTPEAKQGSRAPNADELSRCAPYLAAQISIVKPKLIVAMGAGAMRALFGSTEVVGKLRGRWHELQGIPVMPTFHPSYLIRNQSNAEKRKVWEDLLQVLEKLGCEISEKQRGFFKPR